MTVKVTVSPSFADVVLAEIAYVGLTCVWTKVPPSPTTLNFEAPTVVTLSKALPVHLPSLSK